MAVTNPQVRTFIAAGALTAYRAVKMSAANTVTTTTATTDRVVGITLAPAAAAGDLVPVKLYGDGSSYKITAGAAISVGAPCYLIATGGKFSTTGSSNPQFLAIEAATADGDIIEAIQAPPV